MTNQTRPELLTVEEASDFLRCSTDAIYDACRRGEMPNIRIGRLIRIPYWQVVNQTSKTVDFPTTPSLLGILHDSDGGAV